MASLQSKGICAVVKKKKKALIIQKVSSFRLEEGKIVLRVEIFPNLSSSLFKKKKTSRTNRL